MKRDPEYVNGYRIKGKFATGAYSNVRKVISSDGQRLVAKYIYHKSNDEAKGTLEAEIARQLSLKSSFVVRYHDHFTIRKDGKLITVIIMEDLSSWKTLSQYLDDKSHRNNSLRQSQSKSNSQLRRHTLHVIINNLCKGLHDIHEHNIAHRDIKPENIMINENHDIKYIDFGLACIGESDTVMGTPLYSPPEILDRTFDDDIQSTDRTERMTNMVRSGDIKISVNDDRISTFGMRHDIWSLGVVIYQLANLQRYPDNFPFEMNHTSIYEFIESLATKSYVYPSNYRYSKKARSRIPYDVNKLIALMMTINPNIRPDVNDIIHYLRVGEK